MSNDGAEKNLKRQFGTRDIFWFIVVCALIFSSWRATREHARAIEYLEKSFREEYKNRLEFAVEKDKRELNECKDDMKIMTNRLQQLETAITKYEQANVIVVPGSSPEQKQ